MRSLVRTGLLSPSSFLAQWAISLVVNVLATLCIFVRLYRIANGPQKFEQTFSTEFERQRERWLKPIFTIVEFRWISKNYHWVRKVRRAYIAKGIIAGILILAAIAFAISFKIATNVGGTYYIAFLDSW